MAHMIVEADKKGIFFNKKNNTELKKELKDKWADPSISVDVFRPLSTPENYDDIIKIIDPKSDIPGKPFIFRFAIENRFPALDLSYEPVTNPYKEKYDIIVASGQKIVVDPKGYDPDEDELNYSYAEWRQDYYTIFNTACCKPNGDIDCSKDFTSCLVKKDTKTYNWTQSSEFKLTERKASYTTEQDYTDLGLHLLNVTLYDNMFSDWHIVRILVVDTPVAFANGYNNYSDINNNLTSIEDPYHLNATGSTSIMLPIIEFRWEDLIEPFSLTGGPILRLPETNYTIENIKTKYFTKTMGNGLNHTITLKASNLIRPGEYKFNVTVYKCLPHRNSNTASYPYHTITFDSYNDVQDPFMADHTCCNISYNYEAVTKECYRYNEYGTYEYFETYRPALPGASADEIYQYIPTYQNSYNNDVFKRTFVRNCSGDRGNTCTGNKDLRVTLYDDCHNECEIPGTFTSSSQGPSRNNPISCQNVGASRYVRFSGHGYTTVSGRCSENTLLYASPWHTYAGDNKVECKYACSATGCNAEVDCKCKDEYIAQGYCYYSIGCIAPESCHPIETTLMCKSGSWEYDARCDDCGHVCDLNGYIWYNPYCECVQSGSCPEGYNDLGQTSDCAKCCATDNPP